MLDFIAVSSVVGAAGMVAGAAYYVGKPPSKKNEGGDKAVAVLQAITCVAFSIGIVISISGMGLNAETQNEVYGTTPMPHGLEGFLAGVSPRLICASLLGLYTFSAIAGLMIGRSKRKALSPCTET